MKINEIYNGFKLVSIEKIADIDAKLYLFEHQKSGGKVCYLETDDTNCSFGIGFKTLPEDSTGICHIIEHSVLCGSEKFPLKEPFVNLLKTSVNTFLNAFTASDWTMYPFASQNEKDFDNILSIYLDAVFNPLSVKDIKPFLQEGWHYELKKASDDISIKGVVYNEMKGALSSVDEVLSETTKSVLLKGTTYEHNSGGDPEHIPELTYEAYCDFYKKHYVPENSLAIFYGKMDLEKRLKYLDENYYSKYDKQGISFEFTGINPEINLDTEVDYELGKNEDIKDNTYMGLAYNFGSDIKQEDLMAIGFVFQVLLAKNDSPLKKILLDKGLGEDVEFKIADDCYYPYLQINLTKTNKDKKEQFLKVFTEELSKIVDAGIDKPLLLSVINRSEFTDREKDTGSLPCGIIYSIDMITDFVYGHSLSNNLHYSKYYNFLRGKLSTDYFERITKKYILNSKHYALVVLNPDPELGDKRKDKMDKAMKELKDSLSESEINALVKQTKVLIDYQNHVDTKRQLSCLPKLNIRDISSDVNWIYSRTLKVNGVNGLKYKANTNGIGYLTMKFSLETLTFEDLYYSKLLASLLKNVPTANYTVTDLNKRIDTYLGLFTLGEDFAEDKNNKRVFNFKVSLAALNENINYMSDLINEVLLHSKFNKKEVLQVLKQMATDMKNNIIESGNSVAQTIAKSPISEASYVMAKTRCYDGYKFYTDLIENYDHKTVNEKLKEVRDKIFNKDRMSFYVAGNDDEIEELKGVIRRLKIKKRNLEDALKITLPESINEAIIIPSGVSYNAVACNLSGIRATCGAKTIFRQIVTYDYLWSEIRVKGGAYGCGLTIPLSDKMSLMTYRDPNVKSSYDTFASIYKYSKDLTLTKGEFTSYKIGALGGMDSPASVPSLIKRVDMLASLGYTKADLVENKKSVIKTTIEEVKKVGTYFTDILFKSSICTVGNEAKIKEYHFENIKNL